MCLKVMLASSRHHLLVKKQKLFGGVVKDITNGRIRWLMMVEKLRENVAIDINFKIRW